MAKRDLAGIDQDMFSPIGKFLGQAFAHGINSDIVQGGLEVGQTSLQSVYAEQAVQNCALGSKLIEKESGREFHYSRAGAVALGKALMTQGAVEGSNYKVVWEAIVQQEDGTWKKEAIEAQQTI